MAISLHHAYQAFESMLERLSRALGLPVPAGERSHPVLLDISGLRPAIIPEEAQASWRELLRFRHFFRHAYHVELDPSELVKNRDHLVAATRLTAPRVSSILRALETGAPADGGESSG